MKRKSTSTIFFFAAACLLLAACGGRNGVEEPSGGISQKLDADGYTQKQLENTIPRKGKAFGELERVGEEDAIFCNLPENVTGWESSIPICRDPVYDILYYTEDSAEGAIYAVKDGKTEIAVEMPGTRLFCRDGWLYFLLGATSKKAVDGARKGNILSYNPVDGEVCVISDEVFESIVVYQDMIYCRSVGETGQYGRATDYWFYSFETGELTKQEATKPLSRIVDISRYGKEFLSGIYGPYNPENPIEEVEQYIRRGADPAEIRIQTGLELCSYNGGGGRTLAGMMELTVQHYIKGDELIWRAADGVHFWNILSGKEKILPFPVTNSGFLLADGILYGEGCRMSFADAAPAKCFNITPDFVRIEIEEFYTDGKNVYAVAETGAMGQKRHGLFLVEAAGMEESLPLIPAEIVALWKEMDGEQELGPSFEEYEYIFWLTPLGGKEK